MKRAAETDVLGQKQGPKRKKRIDSCQNCRLRKVKCDQQSPCKHCIRRQESTTCTYNDQVDHGERIDRNLEKSSLNHSVLGELQRVKARLERIEAQGAGASDSHSLETSTTSSSSRQHLSDRQDTASNHPSVQEWKDWSMYHRLAQNNSLYTTDSLVGYTSMDNYLSKEDNGERVNTIEHLLSLLPTRDEAKQLIEDNNRRLLKTIFGNIVHMPSFRREVTILYDEIQANKDMNGISMDWLALLFSFLLLAITHPSRYPGQYPSQMMPDTTLLMHPNTSTVWYNAIISCLSEDHMRLGSLYALQAVILLDFYEADVEVKLSRLRLAITSAQILGLHRLGPDEDASDDGSKRMSQCEREIQKRVWWSLVIKDWNGSTEVYGCIVKPAFCNTPLPSNHNDEDFSQSQVASPRMLEEHTHMSSMLWAITLSCAIRQHGDCVQESVCKGKALSIEEVTMLSNNYQNVWDSIPLFYRCAIQDGYIDLKRNAIMVQSWMLQQGIFHKLLELHCSSFSTRPASFEICFDLAQSILSIQSRIRTTCSLVDQMWVNLAHSFSSAVVLCIGLLHHHKTIGNVDRQGVRILVGEALSTFDFINAFHANAAIRMQRVIDILLVEEEKRYTQSSKSMHKSRNGSVVDERFLKVVAKVVNEVLLEPSRADDKEIRTKTARPFYGLLQPGHVEPNGVRLGLMNSALPDSISVALGMLKEVESTADAVASTGVDKSNALPDLWDQSSELAARNVNTDTIFELPSTSSSLDIDNTSFIDMSQESDGFWSWLLNEDLLMLGGPPG